VSESVNSADASWFNVTIAGKRFNIASRHGEPHIREVERLLEETYEEIRARVPGQTAHNIALLTALNLADQLLTLKQAVREESGDWSNRVELLLQRLDRMLTIGDGSGQR
jgi:cell division protein ZapA (FtsZ GTPase activity inhibitor)